VVGLVVGPKGATIKRIQQQMHTYIVTPSREKEPIFEVSTGAIRKKLLNPFHHPQLRFLDTQGETRWFQGGPHNPGRPGTTWFLSGSPDTIRQRKLT
jgi:KH domain